MPPATQQWCLIGLGANLGDRAATLRAARDRLVHHAATSKWQSSSLYATAPIGGPSGQQGFYNAALSLQTTLSANELLEHLLTIETELGRVRGERWAARTLDLDLLLYNTQTIESDRLTVPHPRMAFRPFVLAPAAEIAADMLHSPTAQTVGQLLARLDRHPIHLAVASVEEESAAHVVNMAQQLLEATGTEVRLTSGVPVAGENPMLLIHLTDEANNDAIALANLTIPILRVPAHPAELAVTEIVAAVGAITDRPQRLATWDSELPPADTR